MADENVAAGAASGALSGAATGATVSGGNPIGAALGALLGAAAGGLGASAKDDNKSAPIDCGFGMIYDPVSRSCVPITEAEEKAGQEATVGQKALRSLAMGMAGDDFGRRQVYNRLYKPDVDAGSSDS